MTTAASDIALEGTGRIATRWVVARKWAAALATVSLLAGWFLLLRPGFLGGPASFVMVSGTSMEPGLQENDLVITHEESGYRAGDVIAYRIPDGEVAAGHLVIHRIIGGSGIEGFVTQGDNRDGPDLWHPRDEDVIGRAWVRIPKGGHVLLLLRAPLPLASLAAGLVMALILIPGKKDDEEPQSSED